MRVFRCPPSERSGRLWEGAWAVVSVLIILGVINDSVGASWLVWLGRVLSILGLALFIAWLCSRVDDGWAEEERAARRAARADPAGPVGGPPAS